MIDYHAVHYITLSTQFKDNSQVIIELDENFSMIGVYFLNICVYVSIEPCNRTLMSFSHTFLFTWGQTYRHTHTHTHNHHHLPVRRHSSAYGNFQSDCVQDVARVGTNINIKLSISDKIFSFFIRCRLICK